MRFTYEEIKKEIKDNLEQIKNHKHPDDLLAEYAESFVPIYYNEIIKDWQEMPSEYDNNWREFGVNEKINIPDLMMTDLFIYYQALTIEAYGELIEEQEEN